MAFDAFWCERLLAEAQRFLPTAPTRARPAVMPQHVTEAAAARELQAAQAAITSVNEEAATVGKQLLPLRSAGDLIALLQVELLYPPGTPARSSKMLVELRCRGVVVPSEFELDELLRRLHATDEWESALRKMTVPAERRCVLVPPVTECVVCGAAGLVPARDGRSTQPAVYSCRGQLLGQLCGNVFEVRHKSTSVRFRFYNRIRVDYLYGLGQLHAMLPPSRRLDISTIPSPIAP